MSHLNLTRKRNIDLYSDWSLADQLNAPVNSDEINQSSRTGTQVPFSGKEGDQKKDDEKRINDRHHPLLPAVLVDELGCSIGDIHDFEL